ncbi:MAG: amino acid permease [Acidimicrobiales bacterium]|jgi:amino acid transporter
MANTVPPEPLVPTGTDHEDATLLKWGYKAELRRSFGAFSSFALAFSIISVTTTYFTLMGQPFQTVGGISIWLWVPATAGILLAGLVYGHMAARIPITGYSYHWCSRLVNVDYGWFTGYNAMLVQWTGTGTIAVALASAFAGDFWANPTHMDTILLASIAVVAAVVINIISIALVGRINNLGAGTELVGTLGVIILCGIGLAFFKHVEGPSVLFHIGSSTGGKVTLGAWATALLIPVFTIGGWEGCADLAEETKDPRAIAPKSMVRGIILSGIVGFVIYAVLAMATSAGHFNSIMNSGTTNPVVAIFGSHFGGLQYVLQAVAFISIFSCVLANVTVATRTSYALSRDNMLPASSILRKVNRVTRTPIESAIAVGVVAIGINFLSSGLIGRIAGFSSVMLYATYGSTVLGIMIGAYRNKIPEADPGYFSLGRWLKPMCWVFVGWAIIVIICLIAPEANRVIGLYVLGFEAAGVLWYLLVLRRRLRRGEAGPHGLTEAADHV